MQVWTVEVESDDRPLHLVVADIPANTSAVAAGEILYGEHGGELSMAQALIVRVATWNDLSDELTRPIRQRAPHLPLHVLYADRYTHHLSRNWNPNVPATIADHRAGDVIAAIREAELRRLLTETNALFRSQGGYNYRVPSGNYTRMFLRVGSMVVTQYALDCFSFWLLPHLHNCAAIVTDTWSVASIGFNAGLRAQAHDPYRTGSFNVGFMSRYHDASPEAHKEFEEVVSRVAVRGQSILFVVSASATGRIIRDMQSGTNAAGLGGAARYVCIYKLDRDGEMPGVPVLCDLSDGIEDSTFACLSEPDDASKVIEIDETSYFPLLIEPLEIRVDKTVTDGWFDLFAAYAGRGAFSVHRDDIDPREPNRPRHHGIHIDVLKLMDAPRFQQALEAKAAEIATFLDGRAPAAIVHPPHDAARALTARLEASLAGAGVRPARIDEHDSLTFAEREQSEWLRSLGQEDQIIILDDVTITGARLGLYQESLRSAGYRGRIQYVVGVARPETKDDWNLRLRNLRFRRDGPRHMVHYVEFLPLPVWNVRTCPWCMEQRKYTMHVDGDLPPALEARSDFLQQMRRGAFTDRLFVTANGRTVPPLTENSLFIPPGGTEADVFVAVASAIHRLRIGMIEGRRLTGPQYPHVNVLAHDDAFKTTFSDPILRLSLLRSCSAPELAHPRAAEEQRRAEAARDLLRGKYADVLLHEIALAVGLRKLPRSVLDEELMAQLDGDAAVASRILAADSRRGSS